PHPYAPLPQGGEGGCLCIDKLPRPRTSEGEKGRNMTKRNRVLSAALLAALAAVFVRAEDPQKSESKMTKTPSGLQDEDVKVGDGASPKKGQTAVVHYTGWLWENGAKGKKFDSSVDRGKPFSFPVGQGAVIKGWDEGVATMKVGGKRILLIPADLGYG